MLKYQYQKDSWSLTYRKLYWIFVSGMFMLLVSGYIVNSLK
jgi:hypothetical protein